MFIKYISISDNFIRVESALTDILSYIESKDKNTYDVFTTEEGKIIVVTNTNVVIKER